MRKSKLTVVPKTQALVREASSGEPGHRGQIITPKFTDADTGKEIAGLPSPRPCPFCHATDDAEICLTRDEDLETYHVQCAGCLGEGPPEGSQLAPAGSWNGRAVKNTKRKDALKDIPDQLASLGSALRGAEELLSEQAREDEKVTSADAVVRMVRNQLDHMYDALIDASYQTLAD